MMVLSTNVAAGPASKATGSLRSLGIPQAGRSVCSSSSSRRLPHSTRSVAAAAAWSSRLTGGILRGLSAPATRSRRSLSAMAVAAPASAAAKQAAGREFVKQAHGFSLVQQQFVREYDSHVLMYKHDKTGAQLISVINSDENKTFGAVFRTPVTDSTGIPHILEHSVLCGSRKYPIKEPFVELMKGSLNTFLNAFTYPDRTCYPVASTNTQDFYNLVDVYLDAVLHPKCVNDRKTFEQEGWHLELDDTSEPLSYKGVVFNEMKGVYSSPDSMFYRTVQQALFPDNTYSNDSGGDPAVIPELTFEQFQEFHAKYYHPSNGRFWFYGDDDPTKRLAVLDAYLSEFEARPVDSEVATQPLLQEPRRVTAHYAAGDSEEGDSGKAYAAVNWVLTQEPLDVETELALGFLDYLMLGTPAAPLRKALNDSGLGAALVGGGMDDELKQPVWSVGLKGVDPSNVDAVEKLVLDKLAELAQSGFSEGAVEAAINTIEFSLRENNTGSFPRGLSLMLRAMGAWIYDRDPYTPIQWEDALNHFKAQLSSGRDVFGPLIHKYLLDNKHRVTVVMLPDEKLGAKIEGDERQKLDSLRAGMSPEQLEAVVKETQALKERQETPDSPEALTCMPSLQLSDIKKTITKVPTAVSDTAGGSKLLAHELFTNDVLYAEAALDMSGLPAHLLPLVPLFCRSLTQMGTDKESFIELTERIGRKTGGVSVYPFSSAKRGSDTPVSYIMIRGKSMGHNSGDLFELMGDILATARLDDKARFGQMVAETKANMEAGIVGSGHRYAGVRLAAQRSLAGWLSETTGGLSYLEFIRTLGKRVEEDWEGVQADLESIRSHLLQRKGTLVNLTGDERALSAAAAHVNDLLGRLPESAASSSGSGSSWQQQGLLPRINEALVVPTQVNYVGKAANLYADAGYELSGSAYVVEKYLGTSWLWDKVRVVGGAYGGFCSFDSHSGMFTYLSYRDPNLLDTLESYDGSPAFLQSLQLDKEGLTKAIIGTMGDIDAYQLPDAKGYAAFSRYLLGVTDEERQQRRDQILSTTLDDFKAFGEAIACVSGPAGRVVAVTSADKAAAVLQEKPDFWEIKKVL